MKTATPEAANLMLRGAIALADVEHNGIRIDVGYLDRTAEEVAARIKRIEEKLKDTDVWRLWRRNYGPGANLDSKPELRHVLYKVLNYPVNSWTSGGKTGKRLPSVDEDALSKIDLPFIKGYLKRTKLDRLHGTYLLGVRREVEGEYLHPFFNLHTTLTYRSSSDSPNFQNVPIRNPEIGKLIRTAFIPRDGHVIVEIDFKAAEVRVAACYHKDPTMLRYIAEGYDYHGEAGVLIYKIPPAEEWSDKDDFKAIRQVAKGNFIFAEFFGDYYPQVAANLWASAAGLRGPDGGPLLDYLATQGITERGDCKSGSRDGPVAGTFEAHIKSIEDKFWGVWFPQYTAWKKSWYAAYLREGGFSTLTGFRCDGIMSRNACINYPVQGSSFHCLLLALIEMNGWLKLNKMRSVVIGQIHDSIISDVHESELGDYLARARYIIYEYLPQQWPWLATTGMTAEASVGESNWFDKREVEL